MLTVESELNDIEHKRLREMRGGCSCHLSPPCANCSDPLTQEEVDELNEWEQNASGNEVGA